LGLFYPQSNLESRPRPSDHRPRIPNKGNKFYSLRGYVWKRWNRKRRSKRCPEPPQRLWIDIATNVRRAVGSTISNDCCLLYPRIRAPCSITVSLFPPRPVLMFSSPRCYPWVGTGLCLLCLCSLISCFFRRLPCVSTRTISGVASVNISVWSGTMEIRAASLWNIRYATIDLTDLYMYLPRTTPLRGCVGKLCTCERMKYIRIKNDWGS